MRILSVFGTRPEAIKMAPVVRALREIPGVEAPVCVTGQHREMLDQVLDAFRLVPDVDLAVMRRARGLALLTGEILAALDPVLERLRPDRVLVHGDTTSTLAAAIGAHYRRIPVGHVEAGLRTHDLSAPWPEEMNRQVASRIADLHFAPTEQNRGNLLAEHVPDHRIFVTGNTVIDALEWVCREVLSDLRLEQTLRARFGFLSDERRVILLTGHRRENLDGALARVFRAARRLAEEHDADLVCPAHVNPAVRAMAAETLSGSPRAHVIEPLDYVAMVWLIRRADLVVTDSGGLQEEAPAVGTPVLVTRDKTERPEALGSGLVRLVGTSESRILLEGRRVLARAGTVRDVAASPYGDGRAARRIAAIAAGRDYEADGLLPCAQSAGAMVRPEGL